MRYRRMGNKNPVRRFSYVHSSGNAYSCQPVCGPARSPIFTGIYPHSNGSIANSIPLGANVKTVGQRLTDNGIYRQVPFGRRRYFGLGKCPEDWDPDYWYDMKCYLEELTEQEPVLFRQPNTNRKGYPLRQ